MYVKIDISKIDKLVKSLNKIKKSALPNAVRNTLNTLAFDVKTKTMPESANKAFINRTKTFFKANSRVNQATGFDIYKMKSEAGFISERLKGSNNYAVKDLEQQEEGSVIKGRAFKPLNQARKGNSRQGLVKPNNMLSKIKNIVNAKNSKGKNVKEKFLKAAYKAGKGGYVISGSNSILFRIKKVQSNVKRKRLEIKAEPLYKWKRRGTIKPKASHFMERAQNRSAKEAEKIFIEKAEYQINKHIK